MSMTPDDRRAIDDLFGRLGRAERDAPAPDGDAKSFIADRIERQPSAPYMMAQTIVMQDYALEDARQRIEALEREVRTARSQPAQAQATPEPERPAGGFLGGLLGGVGRGPSREPADVEANAASGTRLGGLGGMGGALGGAGGALGGRLGGLAGGLAGRGGGGFLAGAAQTAMGVAGGLALGTAVTSLFSAANAGGREEGGQAHAGQEQDAETGEDAGGFGDWGWGEDA